MRSPKKLVLVGSVIASLLSLSAVSVMVWAVEAPTPTQREIARKQMQAGNFRDAYQSYRKLALNSQDDPQAVGSDLEQAINALRRLGRISEVDEFREQVISLHSENWRLLHTAAKTYAYGTHYGYIVAGKYHRGNHRGGGQYTGSTERDRVRALQLMEQAQTKLNEKELLVPGGKNRQQLFQVSNFYNDFAGFVFYNRTGGNAWKLQLLTETSTLPDYESNRYGYGHYRRFGYSGGSRGAPVDKEGHPVFHHIPGSYKTAKSDGQRWRWLLERSVLFQPSRRNPVDVIFAGFLQSQFGVQTMRSYGFFFGRQQVDDTKDGTEKNESGTYALHTLAENETIAKLANGIKRFELSDEFNFIRINQQIAAREKGSYGENALRTLADIFENRRQYSKAASLWRKNIEQYGPGGNGYKTKRLSQIVGNWGRFENVSVQPSGKGATVEYRFRNGKQVRFEAHAIDVPQLLTDVKAYLQSHPNRLDHNKLNISNLGYRLVYRNEKKYLGERVARWKVDLKPRKNHFDERITVTTPLQKPGAYLLVGKMDDGNTSRIILWVTDTVIAQKQMDGRALYYVADALTGKPVAGANLEFFGYRQQHIRRRQYQVLTTNFAEFSDADGLVSPDPNDLKKNYSWIVMARTRTGRFAYLGFNGVWYGRRYDYQYNQTKVFVATDRPVYRPQQAVKFKFWIRNARYDEKDVSNFAHKVATVRVNDPQGKKVFEKQFATDEFGGLNGEYKLPESAPLGRYSIQIIPTNAIINKLPGINRLLSKVNVSGGGTFRVEEYKKPEYQVSIDAPQEPVQLGETITATITAKYYFGAPVTHAKVHYKVTRQNHSTRWYPIGIWDWFYGNGYWWFASDYSWYPGWKHWGLHRPIPIWWPRRQDPPEVILDSEIPIGPDGTVKVVIDTGPAKAMHGDVDHRYQITAEVVDQSRRTIVGRGQVLVARKPFKVFAWVNRGHYRVGDVIRADFKAQTLDQKPVQGTGKLRLLRITYSDNAEPIETEVQSWNLDTNSRGEATVQMKASRAGQYRLSYKVTDKKKHTIEGGYLFTVIGEGFDGAQFRFNDLELVTDKKEYKPGDTVRVMINTNRVGSTVLLFVRPVNGTYPRPQVIRLKGKSTVRDVMVVKKDMPNFFLEAITISGGKLFTETREVVVPPEKRIVNVKLIPSAQEYKPGDSVKVKLKLTDLAGEPFVGSTVLSVYDKSVEYISGGSNVPEIRAFFWKWRRNHSPRTLSNLTRYFANLLRQGETGMGNVGAFGDLVMPHAEAKNEGDRFKRKSAVREMSSASLASGFAGHALAKSSGRRRADFAEDKKDFDGRFGQQDANQQAGGTSGSSEAQPTVRKNFADTAFWTGSILADKDGLAEVSFTMPDSLTTWKIRAWTMGHGTRVGQSDVEVITTKKLLLRMQAPRFFTETDEVVLSANVHNYLKVAKTVRVVLELDGEALSPMDSLVRMVTVRPNDEARVNWNVKAIKEGEAVIRMKALTDEESDAVEMRFPVKVHGMLKTDSYAGVIRPNKTSSAIDIRVPDRRRINLSRLEVRFSPTLAGAMVDALPYLVHYPYGCTEQTLNRFLPTVITQNILKRMDLDLKAIQEKRTNLNAQEIGDDKKRAAGWKRYKRNPVFDEAEVSRMVKQGVKALTEMQLSDGGWGWFSGWGERSAPHTTAVVVHGLQLAQQNHVAIVPGVLERGVAWLKNYQDRQIKRLQNGEQKPKRKKPYKLAADNIDAFVNMVLVDADIADDEMERFLYRDRTKLSVYAQGMFGLALHKRGHRDKLGMIIRNIDQYLVQDAENQTAYLKLPGGGYWWYWYGSEIESNAYYLKLLAKTNAQSPKAAGLVKYLLNNRKHSTYWNSTRDTAIAIEAMAEYLVASGEDRPDMTVEILYDGRKRKEVTINSQNLFTFDNKFVLEGEALDSGTHRIELRKKGRGPLYFNAYVTNFTLEKFITRAGLEIKVNRKYYKLVRDDKTIHVSGTRGQAVGQRVEKYKRIPLASSATLKSGDLVEIELEIDSKNDYEYLVFEDFKAAGFEPVDLKSGYNSNSMGAYMELRDDRVTFFKQRLARGKHSVSYRMRAEIPGRFSALPTKARAMYAPELRANSDEIKITITD